MVADQFAQELGGVLATWVELAVNQALLVGLRHHHSQLDPRTVRVFEGVGIQNLDLARNPAPLVQPAAVVDGPLDSVLDDSPMLLQLLLVLCGNACGESEDDDAQYASCSPHDVTSPTEPPIIPLALTATRISAAG